MPADSIRRAVASVASFAEPFERLEARRLLSATRLSTAAIDDPSRVIDERLDRVSVTLPVATPDTGRDTNADNLAIERAWDSVSDLTRYDEATLQTTREWVVRSDATERQLTRGLAGTDVERSGILGDAFYVTFDDPTLAVDRLSATPGVSSFYPLVAQERTTRLIPNDPGFNQQWHLRNTGQGGGTPGVDVNITDAWDIALGDGVVIGIVDDGVQYTHPDLAANYRTDLDFDFNDNDNFPFPEFDFNSFDFHGTPVAGIAAARGNNGVGVTGAAPQAELAGLRLISASEPDNVEAQALAFNNDDIDIYNNSWGPPDIPFLQGAGPLALQALQDTATNGRDGLGGIHVWAGGNGGNTDNSNYDGYANSRHTLAVGAVDNFGNRADYSERGANLLVVTPSDGGTRDIVTTETGSGYTDSFGGTSAAAPLASGVVALMLSANPSLTYRDVQHILVQTAETIDPNDPTWQTNGAGNTVSEAYGHGNIDALAAVEAAQSWTNVGEETSWTTGNLVVNQAIPDNNFGGVTAQVNVDAGINVEHVEIYVDLAHNFTGDLEIILTSPDGTESVLHRTSWGSEFYTDWTYSSTMHWGENSDGVWSLQVRDRFSGDTGTFQRWGLNLFGTAEGLPAPVLNASSFDRDQSADSIFEFDIDVEVDNAVYSLLNLTSGQTIPTGDFEITRLASTVTATYAPGGVARPLPNGNYIGTLTGVSNPAGGAIADAATVSFFFLQGDLDADREVDLTDAALLERNFGRTDDPVFSLGDIDYDGDVDLTDAALLERNFGATLPDVPSLSVGTNGTGNNSAKTLGGTSSLFANATFGTTPTNTFFANGRGQSLARELL